MFGVLVVDAPNLDETVNVGDANHNVLHSDANHSVNTARTDLDAHRNLGSTAHGGFIPPTIYDAKGDLIPGTAADTYARLPVGSDAQMLVADSTATTGIRWVDQPVFTPGASTIVVQDEGTAVSTTAYGILNFVGSGVTATEDAVNNRIVVTISTSTTTVIEKTVGSDQSITSSSSVVDATGLSQAVNATEVWECDGILMFLSDTAVDIKLTMTGPTGATQIGAIWAPVAAATSSTANTQHYPLTVPGPAGAVFGGLGTTAGNETTIFIKARLSVGSTAGNWRPQWAQGTSNATASKLLANSYLTFARVA